MAGNSGGPWGGGSGGPKRPSNGNDGGRPPKNSNQGQMPPEIDDMLKKAKNSSECLWAEVLEEVAVARVILVTAVWDAIALY